MKPLCVWMRACVCVFWFQILLSLFSSRGTSTYSDCNFMVSLVFFNDQLHNQETKHVTLILFSLEIFTNN